MPQGPNRLQNVQLVSSLIEAYNARDIEAFIAHCDPSVELKTAFTAVGGEVYHGHDGLRAWHRDVDDIWAAIRVEPEAFFDLGEHTLVFYVLHGRGKNSDVGVAMPVALLTSTREGLIVRLRAYAHREDALSDLGLSEATLEPIVP